jgi:hypothetical protein
MSLLPFDWKPDSRKLRQFAVASAVFAGILGAWLCFGLDLPAVSAVIAWSAGAAVLVAGLLVPRAVLPLYVALTAVALPIGLVLSTVILAVVYFLLVTPIGLGMRVLGGDAMGRRRRRSEESFWTRRPPPADVKRYLHQS